ncbi:MAG TPA: ABC transporter substrate-binding protein [Gammaproteobacteria bacterium]|nr:ABC transporter substrate-binding protein [Gammaproteobacteria bacterium]
MRSVLPLMLLCQLAVLCGCARPPDATLRVGLATAPVTLDPRYATDATSWRLCRLVYQAPADFDARFAPTPALMAWTQTSPTRWRFTLRGEPRFHDGTAVTAADVVATYRAVRDPVRASPHRGSLANVVDFVAVDQRSMDVELARPDPLLPGLLVIGVLPARDAALARPASPLGSGPFRVTRLAPKSLELERRADGQRVSFEVVDNETTRALKLARGELDLVPGGFAPEVAHWLGGRPGLELVERDGTTFSYLGFNFAQGPTARAEVREAISAAIDRAAILRHVFRGQARPAAAILVPAHWAGAPALALPAYDPDRSRRLLAGLGYTRERPLALTYKTSSDQFRLRLATILQAQLAEVGIALAVQSYDWGTFYGDIKAGRFELYGLSWVGLQLPDVFRYAFHSSAVPPAGANRGRYASARVDALIERAESAAELTARAALYREIQAELGRDLAYAPLWYEQQVFVRGPRVIGYDTDASGNFDALAHVRALRVSAGR